ncbi:hypothetical protein WR25_20351 [Diploscapter pachys]|uniref:GRIP domain-containing protein n=1 Tax=Diploscapter pachys TaxID=2018661 RepID=A0A2A2J1Q9_9BILA|nr:hypothetical protein WR25_20351 [Diploscapter pachys]
MSLTFQGEKEALLEKLRKVADASEQEAEKMEKVIKQLSDKVKRIEGDRDRELADHGNVLAEMQARYAKEKVAAENAHKQMAELYTKLKDLEENPKTRNKAAQEEVGKLQKELEKWKKKAERTPTVQLLQNQIENMKLDYDKMLQEMSSKGKMSFESNDNGEKLAGFESKIFRLSERIADCEKEKAELVEELKMSREENSTLVQKLSEMPKIAAPECTDLKAELRKMIGQFLKQYPAEELHDMVGNDSRINALEKRLKELQKECDELKASSEIAAQSKEGDFQDDGGLRSLISQLHAKLRNLEETHTADMVQYEATTRNLRERIAELERNEEANLKEIRRETQDKLSQMEMEMQKQRERTLDVVAEKDRELEATKSILVSLRSEQLASSSNVPLDPHSSGKPVPVSKRRSAEHRRNLDKRHSTGSRRSVDAISESSVDFALSHEASNVPLSQINEMKNVFYEDELAKKDKEIQDARFTIQQLEYRLREMEQNALCKDLQHHEMAEKLKEEIRVLEGKLKLVSSGGDIEYLRNIFVQYLNTITTASASSKNILRAMGMVLKLSSKEMKIIDNKK